MKGKESGKALIPSPPLIWGKFTLFVKRYDSEKVSKMTDFERLFRCIQRCCTLNMVGKTVPLRSGSTNSQEEQPPNLVICHL